MKTTESVLAITQNQLAACYGRLFADVEHCDHPMARPVLIAAKLQLSTAIDHLQAARELMRPLPRCNSTTRRRNS